ncbi:hypothetical protein DICPUDRAFT_80676 [Dictyostelium purpureum]|uniref:Profilin n=1 Tax=Dictyostelium purpureum TaxID=5786 RepID=F0ZR72_DICPU|nr:uncharacterized protein DICPUDRAFT_80676 [Dictyostelium purpureum]EGC33568.1 hypothetical protein DICPUDRAFT_80676 [Dictyostelium purpureum]|eukprot:XP_003289917.1 hypothetical protein DICPUDRAFT_80676 [Dictyostelium purpureum]
MLWEDFIEKELIGSGHITSCAIIESEYGDTLASSKNWDLKENERSNIIDFFDSPDDEKLRFTINEVKYHVTSTKENVILGLAAGTRIALCKRGEYIVIGFTDKNDKFEDIARVCKNAVNYLNENSKPE